MKFSIITPTHKPTYISDLYDSIRNQIHRDWEWILYLNNECTKSDLPDRILRDERVKIYIDKKCELSKNVGYQKNKAFNLGTGEVLVEADHDDMLTPDCLSELAKIYKSKPDIGFVSSDDAIYKNGATPFNPAHGWTYRYFDWLGNRLIAHKTFKPSAGSLSLIYYAPDHVRTWRTSVYKEVGGHDVNLSILDDQDLMIRTYLVTKFYHIPKVLYVYRVHGENTWIDRNESIQENTFNLLNKWQQRLAERDADLKGLRKIDIGGGLYPREGYETVDIKNGDIIADLNKIWPFGDNEIGVINASHVLEHLRDTRHSMKEIHRVLTDGSWAFIEVPSTDGRGAWQDPTHVSYWNENSFWYWTQKEQMKFIYNEDIKFQAKKLGTGFPNEFFKKNNIPVVQAWLRAVKSNDRQKYPGLLGFDI